MKYRVKEHCTYKLRRPNRKKQVNTAYERKDRRQELTVNVLIMAKSKNQKNKVTAGDLFGKLGKTDKAKPVKQTADDELLDKFREILKEELTNISVTASAPSSAGIDMELTEEQKLKNDTEALAFLDMF